MKTRKPHRRAVEDDTHPPLILKLKQTGRRWDNKKTLPIVSEGHYGYRAPVECDIDSTREKLLEVSDVRQFKKTPCRTHKVAANFMQIFKRVGKEIAERHFTQYTTCVELMANTSPYDYRLAVCNAIAEVPVVNGRMTHPDKNDSRLVATICWIKLTELFDGLYGEPLDHDYINLLDRKMLAVRLRRIGAYAELNFAYDYTNVLDFVYPVNDPKKWASYPQSWGELTFCCLWRRQQSQFFQLLIKQKADSPHDAPIFNF